ncbi:MAG: D-alanine--D-alanine ligase [Alloprevotella sp.]|nr:D-alanine--D-alanine ligase [Alloprevotella sp.]
MKATIAIVAGGFSSEHDVSLRSAAGIMSFLDTTKYDAYIVRLDTEGWTVQYGADTLPVDRSDFSFQSADGRRSFDFAYITIHGTPGEDGVLQGYFDLLKIPYSTSGVLVEALTFNKYALNNYLRSVSGLHVSDSLLLRRAEVLPDPASVVERLGLPLFVKPNAGGSSYGVTKVKIADAFLPAVAAAFGESDEVMAEALLVGTEVTCGAYLRRDGEVVTFPITEVVTTQEFFDYDAKYNGKVDEITPARIAPETAGRVSEMTRRIYRLLGCYGIIRIDYILSGEAGAEQINLLEVNTTPGMTATSFIPQQVRAAGLDIADVLSDIIEGRLN